MPTKKVVSVDASHPLFSSSSVNSSANQHANVSDQLRTCSTPQNVLSNPAISSVASAAPPVDSDALEDAIEGCGGRPVVTSVAVGTAPQLQAQTASCETPPGLITLKQSISNVNEKSHQVRDQFNGEVDLSRYSSAGAATSSLSFSSPQNAGISSNFITPKSVHNSHSRESNESGSQYAQIRVHSSTSSNQLQEYPSLAEPLTYQKEHQQFVFDGISSCQKKDELYFTAAKQLLAKQSQASQDSETIRRRLHQMASIARSGLEPITLSENRTWNAQFRDDLSMSVENNSSTAAHTQVVSQPCFQQNALLVGLYANAASASATNDSGSLPFNEDRSHELVSGRANLSTVASGVSSAAQIQDTQTAIIGSLSPSQNGVDRSHPDSNQGPQIVNTGQNKQYLSNTSASAGLPSDIQTQTYQAMPINIQNSGNGRQDIIYPPDVSIATSAISAAQGQASSLSHQSLMYGSSTGTFISDANLISTQPVNFQVVNVQVNGQGGYPLLINPIGSTLGGSTVTVLKQSPQNYQSVQECQHQWQQFDQRSQNVPLSSSHHSSLSQAQGEQKDNSSVLTLSQGAANSSNLKKRSMQDNESNDINRGSRIEMTGATIEFEPKGDSRPRTKVSRIVRNSDVHTGDIDSDDEIVNITWKDKKDSNDRKNQATVAATVPPSHSTNDGADDSDDEIVNLVWKDDKDETLDYVKSLHTTTNLVDCSRRAKSFNDKLHELTVYKKEKGHCNVPRTRKDSRYKSLGNWVNHVRQSYRAKERGKPDSKLLQLTDKNIKDLNALGFQWSSRKPFDYWFKELGEFKKKNGHCNVPQSKKESEYKGLGIWCMQIRQSYKGMFRKDRNPQFHLYQLTSQNIQDLNDIGFQWSFLSPRKTFDDWFQELADFKSEHGHLNVPFQTKLGAWCINIKHSYREMSRGIKPKRMVTEANIQSMKNIGFNFSTSNDS